MDGPVIFQARRERGFRGRAFRRYKLRMMVVEAEEPRSEVEHLNEIDNPVFNATDDPR
jgi:lipopolysaccharide/colanic/teichoic acid biosynthesis glycosyltransferase